MFERGLGFEVGSAGQTTGDVSDRQIRGFNLFDLLRYFGSPQHTDSALEVEGRLAGRGARGKAPITGRPAPATG